MSFTKLKDIEVFKKIIHSGLFFHIFDFEGILQSETNDINKIIKAIDSVEECCIKVYNKNDIGYLQISDGEIYDYSDNINKFFK